MLTVQCSIVILVYVSIADAFWVHHPHPNPSHDHVPREEAESTVILTHVIFRHGNRTGQLNEIYPKDPYYNDTYFPIGRGQLTNAGKTKEFNIGVELRTRYDNFLGKLFYPEIVEAVSTDYNRTKASLELVLASLFRPQGENVWNPALAWQPVPYNYNPTDSDPVLMGVYCPNYLKKYDQLIRSDKWQAEFRKNKETFNYINKNTGLNATTYQDIYNLFFGLSTEEEYGQKLPQWTKPVWPKVITDMAIKHYFAETGTTDLLTMSTGYHLKKIVDDTKTKIKNLKEKNGRKMYLYSAHENNVADMLILLNVFNPPHVPTYGSYIVFEVHNINNVIGFKLYYQHYVTKSLQQLKIPSCEEFCPLDKFEKIFEEYLPSSEDFCYET